MRERRAIASGDFATGNLRNERTLARILFPLLILASKQLFLFVYLSIFHFHHVSVCVHVENHERIYILNVYMFVLVAVTSILPQQIKW